jgi:hypothetical protein
MYISSATPANRTMPDTRCIKDTQAVIGRLIEPRSRFTGLLLSTAGITLRWYSEKNGDEFKMISIKNRIKLI